MNSFCTGLVFMLASLPLCAATASTPANVIELAHVNGEAVTSQDLIDAFANRHSGHAKFLGGDREARTFLEILINERLFIQEAFNVGLDQDPAARKKIDAYAAQKAGAELIAEEIEAKATPTEDEIRATWQHLDFVVQGREIAVPTRSEAEEIRANVLRGADFDEFARSCSRAESRSHGGVIVVSWGQREPVWERAVFPLQAGEISPVIETSSWYELVMVDDHIEADRPEYSKVHDDIAAILKERNLQARKLVFSDYLWQKYHVTPRAIDVDPRALGQLLASAPDTVLATWDGGGSLTLKDALSADDLKLLTSMPPRRAQTEIAARIRATVNDGLVTLEARERKIEEKNEVARAIKRFRELLVQDALFREHIWRDISVSDEEVAKFFDDHKGDFVKPEERHVAQVMTATEQDAKTVREKLAGGADFGEIVAKYSRDFVSARSGGDLGWITAEKVPPEFKEILNLPVGAVSAPVRSSTGWHVVKVLEIKPKRQLALDEVKGKARAGALDAKQRAVQKHWSEKLRAAAKIEVHDKAILQFVKENEFKGEAPPQHGAK